MLERINLGRLIEEAVELISKYEKDNIRPETEKPTESQEEIEETSQTSQE